jgi:hypothetical protein
LLLARNRERRHQNTTAKRKLNAIHFGGALLVAGLLGGSTRSLLVFLLSAVALLVAAYHAGDIRR